MAILNKNQIYYYEDNTKKEIQWQVYIINYYYYYSSYINRKILNNKNIYIENTDKYFDNLLTISFISLIYKKNIPDDYRVTLLKFINFSASSINFNLKIYDTINNCLKSAIAYRDNVLNNTLTIIKDKLIITMIWFHFFSFSFTFHFIYSSLNISLFFIYFLILSQYG